MIAGQDQSATLGRDDGLLLGYRYTSQHGVCVAQEYAQQGSAESESGLSASCAWSYQSEGQEPVYRKLELDLYSGEKMCPTHSTIQGSQ